MALTRRQLITGGITLPLFVTGNTVSAAPKSELWDFWYASNESDSRTIDHSAWTKLLGQYISRDGDLNRFDYAGLAENASDRAALKAYIKSLATLPVRTYAKTEQMPYWINLYNAITVDVVTSNWPVSSIRDISKSLFSSGPWNIELVEIEGEAVTLNDIEHRILRPIFNDNRVHYAVNCASTGCPDLQAEAFTAQNIESLLDKGARNFINSQRGVMVDGKRLTVSSIYDWFKADFGGNDAGVIAHLKKYADAPLAAQLARITRVGNDQYDWGVNAIAGTTPGRVMNGSSDSGAENDGSAGGS